MKINTSRKAGFTLVEIMIVVAIIGLLAAIAIPNFVKARNTSQTNACINNLRQLDAAQQQWALESGAADSTAPSEDADTGVPSYIKGGMPSCPASGEYSLGATVVDSPECTIEGHELNPAAEAPVAP